MKKTIIYLVGAFFFALLLSINLFSLKNSDGKISLSLSNLQIASATGDETGSGCCYASEESYVSTSTTSSAVTTSEETVCCTTTRSETGVNCIGNGDVDCTPSCSYIQDVTCSDGSYSSSGGSC
jgi:hypothetical protein